MSRIQRVLTIQTSLGQPLNYTLQATVPAHMLTRCAAALPRLTWEPILFYSTLCIMGFLLFCILVAAYFEADRIFHTDIIKRRQRQLANAYDKNKVLDLRSIGASIRAQDSGGGKVTLVKNTGNHGNSELGNGHVECVSNHVTPHPRRKKESPWSVWKLWTWGSKSTHSQDAPIKPLPSAPNPNTRQRPSPSPDVTPSLNTNSSSVKTVAPTATNNNNNNHKSAPKPWFWQRLFRQKPPAKSAAKPARDLSSPNMNNVTSNGVTDVRKPISVNNGILPSSTPHSNHSNGNSSSSFLSVFSSSSSNSQKRKSANKDNNTADNYVHSYIRQNSDNDITKEQVRLANQKRVLIEKSSSMGLDSLDAPAVSIIDEDDDIIARREQAKRSRQKKPSKAELRREERERERHLKDKLFKEKVLQELERDDTSSTTTESSSLDPDDKMSSARDSTPELTVPKAKKFRAKGKKGKTGSLGLDEDETNDDEFMISSKSKAQKNIKVDPKMAFGGNVFLPNTYELPYTTKLEAETKERNEKKVSTSPGLTPITLDKPARKTNKALKHKGFTDLKLQLEGERPGQTESPPPVWDFPMPPSTGDLSELSIQTEQFAKNSARSNPALGLNTPLSYSNAVSGGATDTSPPPTRNKTQNAGNYGNHSGGGTPESPIDNNLAGLTMDMKIGTFGSKQPIGTKPVSPPVPSMQGHQAWGLNLRSTPSPENQSSNSFCLHPMNDEHPGMMAGGSELPPSGSSVFGLQDGLGQFGFAGNHNNNYEQPQQGQVTMMQRLQQDRRMRVHEYQQKVLQEEWPGFDRPSQQPQSLWDNSLPDGWSTVTDSPPRAQPNPALWDPPPTNSNSPNPSWTNPLASLWSGSATMPPVSTTPSSLADIGAAAAVVARMEQQGSTSPGGTVYDPFNTGGNIWNPTSTSSGSTGWGFPPKPDQDLD